EHPAVAPAVAAEAKIVAHHQTADAEPIDQHPLDEFAGGKLAKAPDELQTEDPLDTLGVDRLQLLVEPHQPCRRLLLGEELHGVGLEDHRDRKSTRLNSS